MGAAHVHLEALAVARLPPEHVRAAVPAQNPAARAAAQPRCGALMFMVEWRYGKGYYPLATALPLLSAPGAAALSLD